MSDETALFDRVLDQSLRGETLDSLMERCFAAAACGDWEQVRLVDEALRMATVLGTKAVVGAQSKRSQQ